MSLFTKRYLQVPLSYQQVWGTGHEWHDTQNSNPLRLAPLYAATALIADAIASSPMQVFRKATGAPVKVANPPQLFTDPGVNMSLFTWLHQCAASMLLRGNAYGLIVDLDSFGIPSKVTWLDPVEMHVDETGSRPVFNYKGKVIPPANLIHIPAYVVAGSVVGLSPLSLFRLQLETSHQAQRYGEKFFNRGAIPSGQLKNTAKSLSATEADAIKTRFVQSVSSSEPFVSGSDWEYTPLTASIGDVRFLDAIKATATQIAAIYRVSPEEVGGEISAKSMTYKNLESDQIKFAVRTLRPWTSRLEATFNALLPAKQYMKFNLDASARADLLTRYQAHQTAIDAGFETIDEARAYEEWPPLTAQQKADYLEMTHVKPTSTVNLP